MNKQELIKRIGQLLAFGSKDYIERNRVLDLVKQLDEPQPVKIPQFVADWIKYCKHTGVNLYNALEMGDLYFYNYANQKDDLKLKEFFETDTNQELFARAWLDGYEFEKEKLYRVCLKGFKKGCNCLNHDTKKDEWNFMSKYGIGDYRTKHTRKQLEAAGFGWVFSCEGVEVEEVE